MPHATLYHLRHSFASELLAEGVPITYVARALGHEKPSTTINFHSHWIPRDDLRYIDQLTAAGRRKSP